MPQFAKWRLCSLHKKCKCCAGGQCKYREGTRNREDYLASVGYDGMQQVYYHNDGGVATFRFAYDDDGVIIYPDMVTVGVALTDGSVASLNATDYVMNHHDRELAAPEISQHEAEKTISSDPECEVLGRAVIHSPGMREVQCYEFLWQDRRWTQNADLLRHRDGISM